MLLIIYADIIMLFMLMLIAHAMPIFIHYGH